MFIYVLPGKLIKKTYNWHNGCNCCGIYYNRYNNVNPITSLERLEEKISIAKEKSVCDIGFHFGTLGDNLEEFSKVQEKVMGLKIYLNQTTGGFVVNLATLPKIVEVWPKHLPILYHAEENIIEEALTIAINAGQRIHVCHVSSESELSTILKMKESYDKITCGVCPHHLFLTEESAEKLGGFGRMKPELKHQSDVDFMWKHIKDIDCVESDHAPHTIEEKESGNVPSGVPGLETTLPLLLNAVHEGKLSVEDIKRLCHDNAAKIFNIKTDEKTYIEIDENEEWTIKNDNLYTKCKWSPFNGWNVKGKLKTVFIRGEKVLENGNVLATAGSGSVIQP
jgi:carbamoyl-phosphate synthase/aspartate carbamoyltransferase/dihydroorotase